MKRLLLILTLLAASVATLSAQRRISPVDPDPVVTRTKQAETDTTRLVHVHDSKGNVVVIDTVSGLEVVDTVPAGIPKMIYPLLYRVSAGLNIWDLAMRCLGQRYGIGSVWAELNMHNRYFAVAEFGLGCADISPDGTDFTFHSPLAPYFKIGAAYNMFYNSNPDYQFLAGLRYGITPFRYSVDAELNDYYWGETTPITIPRQSAFAGYLEITAGVKVKIVSNFSIAWNAMYHILLHESKRPAGQSLYIPGFGKRGNKFTATLSLVWTFDLNHKASSGVE